MRGNAGLVVAGSGARGAYEAGAIAVLVRRMVADGRAPRILVGTSAGALNVVGLAGFSADGLPAAADRMAELWSSVHFDQVADVPASVVDDGLRFTGQFLGVPTRTLGLLDTRRQKDTLNALMPLDAVHDAVANGPIDAVAVATTSVATGGTVVFVEKKPSVPLPAYDERRNITYVETRLTLEHVLASAAVPVACRPVEVPEPATWRGWYVDGGVRPFSRAGLGGRLIAHASSQPGVPARTSAACIAPSGAARQPDEAPPVPARYRRGMGRRCRGGPHGGAPRQRLINIRRGAAACVARCTVG